MCPVIYGMGAGGDAVRLQNQYVMGPTGGVSREWSAAGRPDVTVPHIPNMENYGFNAGGGVVEQKPWYNIDGTMRWVPKDYTHEDDLAAAAAKVAAPGKPATFSTPPPGAPATTAPPSAQVPTTPTGPSNATGPGPRNQQAAAVPAAVPAAQAPKPTVNLATVASQAATPRQAAPGRVVSSRASSRSGGVQGSGRLVS